MSRALVVRRPTARPWRWLALIAALAPSTIVYARADCPSTCAQRQAECEQAECATLEGAAARDCAARCLGRAGCGTGFGTLAYVVTSCRQVGNQQTATQELRIRRRDCDEITVARYENPEPAPDPLALCARLAGNHLGTHTGISGVFQRLGVTWDGSGVVFEVTNQFQVGGRFEVPAERQGFFYVRADGTGLRRLGPPSRDATYRVFASDAGVSANAKTDVAFSKDGRLMAFTDLGPGPDGRETEQIFVYDLATGARRQVTSFPVASPVHAGAWIIGWFYFPSPATIELGRQTEAGGAVMRVRADGRRLRTKNIPKDAGTGEGRIVPTFGVNRAAVSLALLQVPVQSEAYGASPGSPSYELFRVVGERLIQLTNFRRHDTRLLVAKGGTLLFMASGNPFGTNPSENCQIFRVSQFGGGFRQLTQFASAPLSHEACNIGEAPGCGISYVSQSGPSRALLFYSDCDPFGTNPDGGQVFAVDPDGRNLRQLTHTAGAHHDGDAVEIEIAGPSARGGR